MRHAERAELRGTLLDGRYRVGSCIGSGGTGLVFEAERLATMEDVVIKTMRPAYVASPDLNARLRRELEVARRVIHPGIVPVVDHGELDDHSPYIVMKYMRCESLASLLHRRGRLPMEETAVIATRVCSILHCVHQRGYVHRDVKPEHILLNRSSEGDLDVHLLDFGVCAADSAPQDEKDRERGRVFGTPSYSSPEQASGNPDVDGRADLFGLGITMFEMLTGRLPFQAKTVNALLRKIIREDAPRVGLVAMHVDLKMDALVADLLARNPDERPSSARATMRALEPWLRNRALTERQLANSLNVHVPAAMQAPTTPQRIAAA